MRHRLARAILLLYPRRVRHGHGPELLALMDDLVTHEGRSPATLLVRLAFDGLAQRAVSTATVWTVMAVLVTISFSDLALSDFSSASALPHRPGFIAPGRTRRASRPKANQRQGRERSPQSQTRTAEHRGTLLLRRPAAMTERLLLYDLAE